MKNRNRHSGSRADFHHIFRILLPCLIALAILITAVAIIQMRTSFARVSSNIDRELDILCENYLITDELKKTVITSNDKLYQSHAEVIAEAFRRRPENIPDADMLQLLCEDAGIVNLVIIDRDGRELCAAHPHETDFSQARFDRLREVAVTGQPSAGLMVSINNSDMICYAAPIDEERILIYVDCTDDFLSATDEAVGWNELLGNSKPGPNGFCLPVRQSDMSILWSGDGALAGKNIYTFKTGERYDFDVFRINDVIYYGKYHQPDMTDLCLFSLIPSAEVEKLIVIPVVATALAFIFVIALLIHFIGIQLPENAAELTPRQRVHMIRKKLIPIVMICIVLIAGSVFYIQTLCALSVSMMRSESDAVDLANTIYSNQSSVKKVKERYDNSSAAKAQMASYLLQLYPDMCNTESLESVSQILDCRIIRVFDIRGKTVACSTGKDIFSLPEDPDSQDHVFWSLLKGKRSICQDAILTESGEYLQFAGAALYDRNRDVTGFVQIAVEPEQLRYATHIYSPESVLYSYVSADNSFCFAVNKKDQTFFWYPAEHIAGKSTLEYGLMENELRDHFSGFITLNGVQCFASCAETDEYYVFVSVPSENVYSQRLYLTLICTLIAAIVLTLFVWFIPKLIVLKNDSFHIPVNNRLWSAWTGTDMETPQTVRDQYKQVLIQMITLIAMLITLVYLLKNYLLHDGSIIKYIFDGRWERGVNCFALTACLTLLCVAYTVIHILKRIFGYLSRIADARGETVCRLTGNFCNYLVIFIALYKGLSFLGLDTKTLLASAGIMSIVVGLGANKLIGDILAGLAYIFEGEFRVGDVVTAGGCTGTVTDIGIRAIRLTDADGFVHVLNNSQLGSITNRSVQKANIIMYFWVSKSASLDQIRQLLADHSAEIRAHQPAILGDPKLLGIEENDGYNIKIRIDTPCTGKDKSVVTFHLRQNLLAIFESNGISREDKRIITVQETR